MRCKRCSKNKCYFLASKRYRCRDCGYTFTPVQPLFNIPPKRLKNILTDFVLEHSTNVILARQPISKYKLLKVLTACRVAMTKDVPSVFSGQVEVDETYLGGQWKNKRLSVKVQLPKPKLGRGTTKQPIFGILCRSGKIWAELIDNTEARNLQPLIQKQVKVGSTVYSDTWRGYTGIATKGYVHRLVEHGKEFVDKQGNHINGLEGFWGYLKRKLVAKGGVRKSRLHLYLGEYVWRYNHRSDTIRQRVDYLYKLLKFT